MSTAHEEDAFEDANEVPEAQTHRAEDIAETEVGTNTPETTEAPSKKKKNKKKKNKNKSASTSQVDLSETIENEKKSADPTVPSDPTPIEADSNTETVKTAEDLVESTDAPEALEETKDAIIEQVEQNVDASATEQTEVVDEVKKEEDVEKPKEPESVPEPVQITEPESIELTQGSTETESTNVEVSDPPLSKSTDSYHETSGDLEEENRKLEAKLEELKLLEDDTKPEESSEGQNPASDTNSRPVPELPDRANTARHLPPPPPPRAIDTSGSVTGTHEGVDQQKFPFPIPPIPPRNEKSVAPPLPERTNSINSASSPTATNLGKFSIDELPPPPLPPQLTAAQKSQHRGNSVFSSWFSKSSTSVHKSTEGSISEKSIEYEENYDLLLNRLNDNNEEFQSKDESFKDQVNTSENTLRTTFQEKLLDSTKDLDEEVKDSEINDIDWPFWTQVVNDYASVAKSEPAKLSKEIAKGIPSQIRGIIWQLVAKSNPKEYEQQFNELIEKESPFEKNIKKDLSRTSYITENGIDPDSLFRVIKVYSLIDSEVGYTQGMAFITVPLLINLSELETLSLLHKLMTSYHVRSLYLPEMPGLLLSLYQFDRLLEELLPNLHTHFQRQGVRSSMYASQWFLTFFAYKFPLEFVLRIFDIVITEGFESLLKFAIALVSKNEEKLLSLDFDQLLEFLKVGLFSAYQNNVETPAVDDESVGANSDKFSDFFKSSTQAATPAAITVDSYDVDQLVEDATNVKIAPITLKRFQNEYEEIHRQEKERREEVEELRLKNNQLRREIKKIESSYTILNREHVQIANEMINGRMKIATLEDENKDLKDQNNNLRERIKLLQTPTEIEVPSSLEDDLKLTMERNLEVMTKNEELENQISELLQEVESLRAANSLRENGQLEPTSSPEKHHRHSTSSSNWTKSLFKR